MSQWKCQQALRHPLQYLRVRLFSLLQAHQILMMKMRSATHLGIKILMHCLIRSLITLPLVFSKADSVPAPRDSLTMRQHVTLTPTQNFSDFLESLDQHLLLRLESIGRIQVTRTLSWLPLLLTKKMSHLSVPVEPQKAAFVLVLSGLVSQQDQTIVLRSKHSMSYVNGALFRPKVRTGKHALP